MEVLTLAPLVRAGGGLRGLFPGLLLDVIQAPTDQVLAALATAPGQALRAGAVTGPNWLAIAPCSSSSALARAGHPGRHDPAGRRSPDVRSSWPASGCWSAWSSWSGRRPRCGRRQPKRSSAASTPAIRLTTFLDLLFLVHRPPDHPLRARLPAAARAARSPSSRRRSSSPSAARCSSPARGPAGALPGPRAAGAAGLHAGGLRQARRPGHRGRHQVLPARLVLLGDLPLRPGLHLGLHRHHERGRGGAAPRSRSCSGPAASRGRARSWASPC